MELTPRQREAAEHISGNLQIIACAGCDFAGICRTRPQQPLAM